MLPPRSPNPALISIEAEMDEGHGTAWLLAPNQRASHEGVEVRTNALGCRDEEVEESPRRGGRRMLVTGDSFVYGEGTAQESIFPYALREAYDGRYDVVGCGLWGYNTLDSYMLYRERLSQLAPDIVLHVFVLNDAECRLFCTSSRPTADPATDTQATWNRIRRPLNHWLSPNSRLWELFSTTIDRAIGAEEAKRALLQPFSDDSPGWDQSRRYLLKYRDAVQSQGGRFAIAVFPQMADFLDYPFGFAHDTVRSFCASADLTCIDLLPAFEADGGRASTYRASILNWHPSAKAYAVAARYVARMLPAPQDGASLLDRTGDHFAHELRPEQLRQRAPA